MPMTRKTKRLEDGTPYYGMLGELAYDAEEDKVQCHLCGGWYRAIGGSHLRRTHGWTLAAYRDAFRLPMQLATCSHDLSQRARANAISLIGQGEFGKGVGVLRVPIEQRAARIRPWRTLFAQHPELRKELHPVRNAEIDFATIAAKSDHKLWWRCRRCGHDWQATAGSRSAGHGCPECYNEQRRGQGPRAVPAGQSLEVLNPDVAAEWDHVRNGAVHPAAISPNSKQKAWWRCGACGHEWQATVQNRTAGHGCPKCGIRRRARNQSRVDSERTLAVRHPELALELHPARNEEMDLKHLGARSGLKVWWQCKTCGHEWQATVASRTYAGTGCPICGLRRRAETQSKVPFARSLAAKHPDVAGELHPSRNPGIDPAQLGSRSSRRLWWRCGSCGHEWRTAVSTRTDGSGCPACHRAKHRHPAEHH